MSSAFYGRETELDQLLRGVDALRAGAPSWVALLGSRKIGKTSLLLELSRRAASRDVVFSVVDVLEHTPVDPEVIRQAALTVVDAVLGAGLSQSLQALATEPAEYVAALAGTVTFPRLDEIARRVVIELPTGPMSRERIRQWLELPEWLARALEIHVVSAWDEFQALEGLKLKRCSLDLFALMRSVWQRHQHVTYFISGSEPSLLRDLTSAERSPFFQHFALMELGALPLDVAERLLIENAPPDRPMPVETAQAAAELMGGHPFYVQMLGDQLTHLAPPYDATALKEAVQGLMFTRTGRLALYFEGWFARLVGRSTQLAAVLRALAAGPIRLTDVATRIGAASGSTVRYLERLGDAVTVTDAGRYTLVDPVFALWLRWRQPGGTIIPMAVIGDDPLEPVPWSDCKPWKYWMPRWLFLGKDCSEDGVVTTCNHEVLMEPVRVGRGGAERGGPLGAHGFRARLSVSGLPRGLRPAGSAWGGPARFTGQAHQTAGALLGRGVGTHGGGERPSGLVVGHRRRDAQRSCIPARSQRGAGPHPRRGGRDREPAPLGR